LLGYYGGNVIIHNNRLKRKGTNRSVEKWLSFVGRYIKEWESTPTNV
jgi:hypothetical protein